MYYRPAGDYTWHWGRGLPEKTFEKWIDANRAFSAHFLSIKFCILPIDIFPKLWLFLPSKLRSPVFVLRENFHISCRGSYKVQEGSFYPLVVVGGGGGVGDSRVSPRFFFLKNGCKWCILILFWADCLLIFSPKLWLIFATISSSLCI